MVLYANEAADVVHMRHTRLSVPGWEDIELHVRWCERRDLRPRTVGGRRDVCMKVATRLGKSLLDATGADIRQWWDAHPGVPGSRRFDLLHLRGFFRWAVAEGLRDDDPTEGLAAPKVRRGLPRPMSEDRVQAAIDYAPERIRPWLVLAAYAGFRACEVATLEGDDIRHDLGVVYIREGKGGKQRAVPMHPIVVEALKDAPPTGPVFTKVHTGEQINARLVSQLANSWLRRIGADGTFHSLRHRFATRVYAASEDLRLTQELLGHSDPQTTAIYTALSPKKAKSAIDSI